MNFRYSLGLLTLLGVLAFFYLKGKPLLPVDGGRQANPTEFSSLQVTQRGSSFELEKADSAWTLKGLPEAQLDPVSMETFLGVLAHLRGQPLGAESDFTKEQLISFGLEPGVLKIETADQHTYRFGHLNKVTGRRYLASGKGPQEDNGEGTAASSLSVQMVGEDAFKILSQGKDALRDVKPLKFKIGEVSSFVFHGQKKNLKVIRKDDRGQFFLHSDSGSRPELLPIDEEFVAIILGGVANIEAKKYFDNPTNYYFYGLEPEKFSLEINFGDETFSQKADVLVSSGPLAGYSSGEKSKTIYFGEVIQAEKQGLSADARLPQAVPKPEEHREYFLKLKDKSTVYQYEHPPYLGLIGAAEQMRDRSPYSYWSESEVEILSYRSGNKIVQLSPEDKLALAKSVSALRLVSFISPMGKDDSQGGGSLGKISHQLEFRLDGEDDVYRVRVGEALEQLDAGNDEIGAPYFMAFQSPSSPEMLAVVSSETKKSLEISGDSPSN